MNENLELLNYVYENASMAVFTLDTLETDLKDKDNKIKKVLKEELTTSNDFKEKVAGLLKEHDVDFKEASMMEKMMAAKGIKMETKKDNSDSAIAKMLIEGLTMGVVELQAKYDDYKDTADKEVIKLTKDYLKHLEKQIKDLKEYL